jgi:hypothetical protein
MELTLAEARKEILGASKRGILLTIRVVTGGEGCDIRFVTDEQLGIKTWYFTEADSLGNITEFTFHPDDICLLGPYFFPETKALNVKQAVKEICDLIASGGKLVVNICKEIIFSGATWQLVKDKRLPRAISYVREYDETDNLIRIISFKYDMDVIITHVAKEIRRRKIAGTIILD